MKSRAKQSTRLANQRAAGAESIPNWFAGAFYVDFGFVFFLFFFWFSYLVSCISRILCLRLRFAHLSVL